MSLRASPGRSRPLRILIHAGPHKTGSTYLQLCFEALRQELRARGILFPELWHHAPGTPSQSGFTQRCMRGEFDLLSEELESVVTPDIHTVLVSNENISNLDAAAMAGLARCLEGTQAQIVFYLRRWSDLIPSAWQEQVKQGHAATLPEYAFTLLRNPEASKLLNWERKLAPAMQAFGRDALSLVAYTWLLESDIDLFDHFASCFLDWQGAPIPSLPPSNASRAIEEISLLRALNAMAARDGRPPSSALRTMLFERGDDAGLAGVLAAMQAHTRTLAFHDNKGALAPLHDRLFETLEDLLVAPRMKRRLFQPQGVQLRYVGCDFLGEPGVAEGIREYYEKKAVLF